MTKAALKKKMKKKYGISDNFLKHGSLLIIRSKLISQNRVDKIKKIISEGFNLPPKGSKNMSVMLVSPDFSLTDPEFLEAFKLWERLVKQ